MTQEKRHRLIFLRERAGLSQEKAADQMGKHRSVIAKLEGGARDLSDRDMESLAQIYRCKPWELMEGAPLLTEQEWDLVAVLAELTPKKLQALWDLLEDMPDSAPH